MIQRLGAAELNGFRDSMEEAEVAQAENEFTDEADSLMSRNEEANNFIIITGE